MQKSLKPIIPAVFLGAPNLGSMVLVGLPFIRRVGDPWNSFFMRRSMVGEREEALRGEPGVFTPVLGNELLALDA